MIRVSAIVLLAAALAAGACQPAKTPEQIAAENQAKAMQEMIGALAGGAPGTPGAQISPEQMASAMAGAAAMAGAMGAEMSAEDRAKLQAISGALATGQVHPAASAYVAGLDKVFAVISTVKDDAGVEAARPKLAAIYADMSGPAAQLKGMSETDREVAFGSAYPQFIGFAMKMTGVMMPLASNPDLAEKVGDLLEAMPEPE